MTRKYFQSWTYGAGEQSGSAWTSCEFQDDQGTWRHCEVFQPRNSDQTRFTCEGRVFWSEAAMLRGFAAGLAVMPGE